MIIVVFSSMDAVAAEAVDWALCHGLLMQSRHLGQLTHAPFTLLPTPLPRSLFEYAQSVATDFNLLVFNVARDADFLESTLHSYTTLRCSPLTSCKSNRR